MTAPAAVPAAAPPPLSPKRLLVWIAAFYFASGLPYGILNEMLPIYLRDRGVPLAEIGRIIGIAGYAWTLKFLWSPLADRFGTRKRWIVGSQLALAAGLAMLATAGGWGTGSALALLLFTIAALSATQDISLDAYTIEAFEERMYGAANGIRVTAYRIAMLTASGLLVALAARTGWPPVFLAGAALMAIAAVVSFTAPATPRHRHEREPLLAPLVALARTPAIWAIVLFALTFKLGDAAMQVMARTFLVDAGLTLPQIGALSGFGIVATLGGALLGGLLITRWGIFRSLWTLGLVQALSNLGYWLAARGTPTVPGVYAAKLVEDFTAGLGTAAFLAFLMSICERRFAATQYALLSALFIFGRQLAIQESGAFTERFGYADYFLVTFLLAFPAFALLPLIRKVRPQR